MYSSDQELEDPNSRDRRISKWPQCLATALCWLAPVVMGFGLGYSSPAIEKLKEGPLELTEDQASWFASLLAVGALIGGPCCGFIIEKLGRKYGVMTSGLPFVLGWLLIAYSPNVYVLYLGRTLTGFGCGMVSLAAPTYIAEVTSKELRGLLGGGFQLAVVVGVLITFCAGYPLSYSMLAILGSIFTTCMVIAMLFVPETPRWYFGSGDPDNGMKSLRWLRGPDANIEGERQEIEVNILNQTGSMKFSDFFRYPNLYKPLIISLMLMFFQQFSGINAVLFFSNTIFKDASYGSSEQEAIASIVVAVIQVIFTLIGCVLMDRAGRRVLLIVAGSIMALSCITFAVYYILKLKEIVHEDVVYMKLLSVGSLGVYISGFSIGWGPIPWLIMSEIFPSKARGLSSSMATAFNWTCAFFVTRFFQALQVAITPYGTFFAFAVINILGVIYVALCLPETKGKSLEDIERIFLGEEPNEYSPLNEQNE